MKIVNISKSVGGNVASFRPSPDYGKTSTSFTNMVLIAYPDHDDTRSRVYKVAAKDAMVPLCVKVRRNPEGGKLFQEADMARLANAALPENTPKVHGVHLVKDQDGIEHTALVSGFVNGKKIRDYVQTATTGQLSELFFQFLKLVRKADSHGLLYLDYKEDNILVLDQATGPDVCFVDHGGWDHIGRPRDCGDFNATYIHPEQTPAPGAADRRNRLSSLGCLCAIGRLVSSIGLIGRLEKRRRPACLRLVAALVASNPARRPGLDEAMGHPFFDTLPCAVVREPEPPPIAHDMTDAVKRAFFDNIADDADNYFPRAYQGRRMITEAIQRLVRDAVSALPAPESGRASALADLGARLVDLPIGAHLADDHQSAFHLLAADLLDAAAPMAHSFLRPVPSFEIVEALSWTRHTLALAEALSELVADQGVPSF